MRRIEVYNEPELDNDFQATSTTYKTDLWLETMALRSAAVQHAYADLSAEQPARAGEAGRRCGAFAKVGAAEMAAGVCVVPPAQAVTPDIHVGAFTKVGGRLCQGGWVGSKNRPWA